MKDVKFEAQYSERQGAVAEFLTATLRHLDSPRSNAINELIESMEYSLLQGGKRFRPVLSLFLAEAFGAGPQKILPWAAAIEMVHTYSLIHDDLPCMDNDDYRRGMPTNHKAFGESTALLAGDALLTEAFRQISIGFESEPEKVVQLVRVLSEASGVQGMVGGQAIDLNSKANLISIPELNLMHGMKTGALIRAACEGAAIILGLPKESREKCRQFGALLGLSFQLKDDLLDSQEQIEKGSYPEALGLEKTREYLDEINAEARKYLLELSITEGPLHQLLQMNSQRKS